MKHEDLYIIVNNERIGAWSVIGAQPDISFFEQNFHLMQGVQVISFQVGGHQVVNRIELDGAHVRIDNNHTPLDMDAFVDAQKKRIHEEQARANFSDELTDVYFLPAGAILARSTLPLFDHAILAKEPGGKKFFVSHRWHSIDHPDPDGAHFAFIRNHARQHLDAHYWIDFSCLPQPRIAGDSELFKKTLPKIASIQSKSSTLVLWEERYGERLWCYIEHYTGLLYSLTNFGHWLSQPRTIEYLGSAPVERPMLIDMVQTLREPAWEKLRVTDPSDIPSIKYNYTWMVNLVKFQLADRFHELRRMLPAHDLYSGRNYFESAFGLRYEQSLKQLRELYVRHGGNFENFYTENSLNWLAQRLAWSDELDHYDADRLRFSEYMFHSKDMVGWIALILAIINRANEGRGKLQKLRLVYARIVLMALFA
jgi:hypothetical protein